MNGERAGNGPEKAGNNQRAATDLFQENRRRSFCRTLAPSGPFPAVSFFNQLMLALPGVDGGLTDYGNV
jgi:hypothetical protein